MNDRMRLARFSLAAGVAMTALAAFSSEAAAQTETAIGTTFALADPATVTGSADDGAANAGPEDEIIVSGRYNYLKEDTRGTTNLPLPIEEVPQSITLVSSDFIEAAGLNTIGEIAEYTPGAINAGNTGGTGSVIKLRGFSPGYAIDGINIIQNATYHEYDFAIFDRLEVVKGPSSVVYGVSSPGGLVNLVTRGAKASTPSYIDVEVGSWQNYRAEGQVAGALDAQDDVRAIGIGVYDQGDSFLKENSHKRTVLYAGLDFSLSPSLSGFLHGGYENFDRTSFDGTPALPDGSRAPVPKSFCLCSSNISLESSVYHAEGSLTWNASSMLELSLRGNYQQLKTSGQVAYASGLQSNGDINLTVQGNRAEVVNFGIGLSSVYKLDDLGMPDSFISIGALYQDSDIDGTYLLGAGGSASIFDSQQSISDAFDALRGNLTFPYRQQLQSNTFTISGQAVLKVADPITLLLGISHSSPKAQAVLGGVDQGTSDKAEVSYRAAVTYEVSPALNAYVSYSESFVPQPLPSLDQSILPALTGEQYEAGVKYMAMNGRLLLTGAVYRIRENNLSTYDQSVNGVDFYRVLGEVVHSGVELQALGHLTDRWQINAGYAYLHPKITESIIPESKGRTALFLPKQTLSLFTSYDLGAGGNGWTFSGGARYVSKQATSFDGSTKDLPGYAVIDLGVAYHHDDWNVQLNVRNALDKRYYINNYQTLFYGNFRGDPANFSISVRRIF